MNLNQLRKVLRHFQVLLMIVSSAWMGMSCKTAGRDSLVKNDFIAPDTAEFTVSGTDYVDLEAEYANKTAEQRLRRARVLASYRARAVGFFLKCYIEDKEEGDANFNYGRFNGAVRVGTDTSSSIQAESGLRYSFRFSFQIAGYRDLIRRIQEDQKLDAKAKTFTIQTAELPNRLMAKLPPGDEWFRSEPYQSFNPATLKEPLRPVQAEITEQIPSRDAYLPIDELTAKGKLSMSVHFGWDGESEAGPGGVRNDIVLGRQLFEEFVKRGFTPPVAKASDYQPFSKETQPLFKTITINGKKVRVEVSIYFAGQPSKNIPGPDPETNEGGQQALDQLINSFATQQVIAYLGHSGMGAGFNMSNWDRADVGTLTPGAIATMKMLPSFQLVLVDGCQTYYLADSFWQNPAKTQHKHLNLITSLGFTDASSFHTILQVSDALTAQEDGRMIAPRIQTMLKALNPDLPPHLSPSKAFRTGPNAADEDPIFPVYGVHGIEQNPTRNPLADPTHLCRSCTDWSDCGGDGAICAGASGHKFCSFGCTADAGCGAGYVCRKTRMQATFGAGICQPVEACSKETSP